MTNGPENFLDPDEIESLINSVRSSGSGSSGAGSSSQGASESGSPQRGSVDEPGGEAASAAAEFTADDLLREAENHLAAAMSPEFDVRGNIPRELGDLQPFSFNDFGGQSGTAGPGVELSALQDVELDLRIELGRTELLIEEVLRLKEGSVVPLDKLAGDPVDILVNGRLIARGEVLVLNDNFCVRVAEILSPEL